MPVLTLNFHSNCLPPHVDQSSPKDIVRALTIIEFLIGLVYHVCMYHSLKVRLAGTSNHCLKAPYSNSSLDLLLDVTFIFSAHCIHHRHDITIIFKSMIVKHLFLLFFTTPLILSIFKQCRPFGWALNSTTPWSACTQNSAILTIICDPTFQFDSF